jgi:hypothetical protein
MMKKVLLIVFAASIFIGCTSVPVPTPEQNTLLAGKFLVNWKTTNHMSGGNGTNKANTKIYFQNAQTEKVISVSTQEDGWLLTSKLASGHYTITKFYIEKQQGSGIYQMTLSGPFPITLGDGIVNNIGVIQIDIGNAGYTYRVVDYDVVKFDFQNEFSDSEWISYEWENNPVFGK